MAECIITPLVVVAMAVGIVIGVVVGAAVLFRWWLSINIVMLKRFLIFLKHIKMIQIMYEGWKWASWRRTEKPKHDVFCSFSSGDKLDQRGKHFAHLNPQDRRLSCIYNLSFWSPDMPATQWSRPANCGQRRHTAKLQLVTLAPIPPGFLRTRLAPS